MDKFAQNETIFTFLFKFQNKILHPYQKKGVV